MTWYALPVCAAARWERNTYATKLAERDEKPREIIHWSMHVPVRFFVGLTDSPRLSNV
jgi:hypothetical protein